MPAPGFAPGQGSHGKDGLDLPWECLGKRGDTAERAQVQTQQGHCPERDLRLPRQW